MIVKIKEIILENYRIKTFVFNRRLDYRAGNFIMVGLPSVAERPMSLSFSNAITVAKVGKFTEILHNMKIGNKLMIRGPYGNHFKTKGKRWLIVAGGYGVAPFLGLIKKYWRKKKITMIYGVKTRKDIIRENWLEERVNAVICSEDGSVGEKGLVTDILKKIDVESYDNLLVCGPEKMMLKIYEMVKNKQIFAQFSLERYMRCGIGICGSCCIGKFLVCKDGPVFTMDMIREVEDEFGKVKRDRSGRKIGI